MGSHVKQCSKNSDVHLHQRRGHVSRHQVNTDQQAFQGSEKQCKKSTSGRSVKSSSITLTIPKWLYCYLPLIILALLLFTSAWISSILWNRVDNLVMQRTEMDGWEVVDLFGNFDTNGDFYLSFDEALPLIRLMSEFKEVVSLHLPNPIKMSQAIFIYRYIIIFKAKLFL